MKKRSTHVVIFILFLAVFAAGTNCYAQQPAFYDEIRAFKKQDSAEKPAKNAILFVGSSSFRMWTSIKEDFRMHSVVNRGFGGSSLVDVIRYVDEIIVPYNPAQVVIYCGDNDLAASDTVTSQIVFERFQTLFTMIRKQLPDAAVAFVSIKPSPSRAHLLPKVIAANNLIRDFLKGQQKAAFIDVFSAMIDQQGNPKPDLFIDDKLHMNQKGYAIWVEIIEPYLIKQ